MAEVSKATIEELISGLNKHFKSKKESPIASLASGDILPDPTGWVSTGLDELDLAIKEGIPCGRITEILGTESRGKSALAASIAAATQRQGGLAALLDSESTFEKNFAATLGVDLDRMVFLDCPTLEDGFERIEGFIDVYLEKHYIFPTVVLWDTLAAAPTRKELEEGTYSGGIASKPRGVSEFL